MAKSMYALATGNENPLAIVDAVPQTAPYVQFASTKSSKWGDYSARFPSLQDGDPVLVRNGEPLRLQPMKFFIANCQQYWAIMNDQSEIVRARFQRPDDRKFAECVEASLLVFAGETLVPALCTFRGPKCPAVLTVAREIAVCTEAEWARRSADHALAVKSVSDPRLRVTGTVRLQRRTSKSSGFAYVVADSNPAPVTAGDLTAFAAMMRDEQAVSLMKLVSSRFDERINGIKAKAE